MQDFLYSATLLKQKIYAALVPYEKLLNMVPNDRMFVPIKHKLLTIHNRHSPGCFMTCIVTVLRSISYCLQHPSFFTSSPNPKNPKSIVTNIKFVLLFYRSCSPYGPHNEYVERVFLATLHSLSVPCLQQCSFSLLETTMGDHFVDPCTN